MLRTVASILVVSSVALGGRPSAGAERLVPVHRLADERALAARLENVPTATVGPVTRYVLAAPIVGALYPRAGDPTTLRVPPDGTLEIAVTCPRSIAGSEVAVAVRTGGSIRRETIRCPLDSSAAARLRVDSLPPGKDVSPLVIVNTMPSGTPKTDALRVLPGSVLRVALGRPDTQTVDVRFRVIALRAGRPPLTIVDRSLPAARDRGWVDVEAPLDGLAGADVRLAFQARARARSEWPVTPVWGDPTIFAPTADDRPNVVLVSLDTLRADRLGAYGATRPTTPVIDRLAAEGTLFETAITAAPWTLPSHLTMLSGVYPCVHGLVTDAIFQRLPGGVHPLAAILRAEGYTTAAFTEDGYILPEVFQPGFDVFSYGTAAVDGIERTVGAACAWLRDHARTPFFLFVHTYQVHWPYQSPAPYHGMFAQPEARAISRELDDYDAALRYADATLASLVAAIDQLGLASRTVLVVTSDHGEAFNEHGTTRHGNAMYEEILRVPLVWRAPGMVAAGRRVHALVGLIDVVPTILDLLSLPAPAILQGQSLAPLLRGETEPGPPRVLFAENALHGNALVARSQAWKAFFDGDGPIRIHALSADPDERDPGSGRAFAAAAEAARAGFVAECERVRGTLGGSPAETSPVGASPPDDSRRQKLRALGYVE